MQKIELLAPGGRYGKVKNSGTVRSRCGVLGGEVFSLRARAGNLTVDEMKEAMVSSHSHVRKGISDHQHLSSQRGYSAAQRIYSADGIFPRCVSGIRSGVMQLVKDGILNAEIHLSTGQYHKLLEWNFWVSQE